jgi:type 2 lantibiotic biosynthesis protein LanM
VTPLGPDLYDGTAGIVLFLAYLGALTKEQRYVELASAGVHYLNRQVATARGLKGEIGAFSGWGGLIYAYSHLAVLWDSEELLDRAHAIVEEIFPLIERDEYYDIIGGAAGCIGSLLASYHVMPSDAVLTAAMRCGERLVQSARSLPRGVGWTSKWCDVPLAGFSHGAAGIAWALLKLQKATGENRFGETAMNALEYERSLFDPDVLNWSDLRPPDGVHRLAGAPMIAWCHGAAGIGLSRLSLLADESSQAMRSEFAQAVETTIAATLGDNHSLCHGDFGNLDFIVQASESFANDAWHVHANRRMASVLDDVACNGWKCGVENQAEIPGLMTGLAGIGYGMLRLAAPRLVPSVLLLTPPATETLDRNRHWTKN